MKMQARLETDRPASGQSGPPRIRMARLGTEWARLRFLLTPLCKKGSDPGLSVPFLLDSGQILKPKAASVVK